MSEPIMDQGAGVAHVLALGAPLAVRSVDVKDGFSDIALPASSSGAPYRGLLVLVRVGGTPVGWLGVEAPATALLTASALEGACREQLMTGSLDEARARAASGSGAPGQLQDDAMISHVVTTCNQASVAVRCVRAIVAAEGGPFEVVVVENRPARSTVHDALRAAFSGDERIRYVAEPVAGLSRARNTGLAAAQGRVVAFTDDDITVDPGWCGSLREAFARDPGASCVTGPILPAELETDAQVLMERFATLGKGFVRRTYSLACPPARDEQPLFPYTAGFLGSGGNAAFDREALLALGGFDPALGIGTPAHGGEDLDIFIRLILAGRTLVYEPGAIAWHPHPSAMGALSREVFSYGVGLGAMLTKQLVAGPQRLRLIEKIPRGFGYLANSGSRKNAAKGSGYPSYLDRLEQAGLALGPAGYACSRWRDRRLAVGRRSP